MRFFCGAIPALSVALGRQAEAFVVPPSAHHVVAQGVNTWSPARGFTTSPSSRDGRSKATATSSRLSMGLFDDISGQMKTCLKSGDKDRLNALRMIRAAFLTETKTAGSGDTLPDDKCIPILRKMSKMQQESIDMYRTGKREDLVEKELIVQAVIEGFLPKLADEATTQKWVDAAIAASGAKGPSDMGKVMGLLMKEHKAEMDGKIAQRLVSAKLKGAA